jgi:sugar phosphate isomerase/epimerase
MGEVGICLATLLPDPMAAGPDELAAAADAIAAAGVTEISVWAHQLAIVGGVERFGLRVSAIEAAMSWAGGPSALGRTEVEGMAAAGAAAGARVLVAVCLEPALDMVAASEGLAMVVEIASAAGLQTCVEFLPWSGIPDLATAWRLVEPLGPRAGILLDTWHWQRQPGGPAPELLATIPGERIGYVQLCDAAPGDGRSMDEAMTGRLLPGDGVVDFPEVARLLQEIAATPVIATEVFNPSLLAERGAAATAAAFVKTASAAMQSAKR